MKLITLTILEVSNTSLVKECSLVFSRSNANVELNYT